MGQRTLIDGTAYTISGGRAKINGTSYNIKGGTTLVNGTAYNISFAPKYYAFLYNTGDLAFKLLGTRTEAGKTVLNQYTNFINSQGYPPWVWTNTDQKRIKNVYFNNTFAPTSVSYWFYGCKNLISINTVNLDTSKVTDAVRFMEFCESYTGPALNLPNATNMQNAYYGCKKMTGSPKCGDKVTSLVETYRFSGVTGDAVCGANVTTMYAAYADSALTGNAACGNKVIDMFSAYMNCYNLKGKPVIGPNVTNADYAYQNCYNMTGSPVCSAKLTNFNFTFCNCYNITGSPVTSENAIGMRYTYYNCRNLTGRPVIGNKVVQADFCYADCVNLTLGPIVGANVTNLYWAFARSTDNMGGNSYIYANNITDVWWAYRRVNGSAPRLNIYFHANTTTHDSIMGAKSQNTETSLTGQVMTFTHYSNGCSKVWQNLYFYPVTNVAAARAANGD